MARTSPLLSTHEAGEGLLIPYGPAVEGQEPVMMVAAFDPVEIEYASIRRAAAVFDQPQRSTLVVTGTDRLEFLNRMLTQELSPAKGFGVYSSRSSFWLSRKGRIDADVRVLHLPDRVILDLDVHAVARAKCGLESYIITEDVVITDASAGQHRLGLHGPGAAALLARLSTHDAGVEVGGIQPGQVSVVRVAGAEVVVDRLDTTGEIGLELLMPASAATAVYEAISTSWSERSGKATTPQTGLARRIGWHALNIARIEAGQPAYYLDFGPDSLPHETGVLHDRVSFKKGCYLGQEVVARMESLGHPKQTLVGLDISAKAHSPQAETGTQVLGADADDAPIVGAVTSSCISPMLGSTPVAFAMVKWASAQAGTNVWLSVHGTRLRATIRERLRFLPAPAAPTRTGE